MPRLDSSFRETPIGALTSVVPSAKILPQQHGIQGLSKLQSWPF
jgi:hypothetical protein